MFHIGWEGGGVVGDNLVIPLMGGGVFVGGKLKFHGWIPFVITSTISKISICTPVN